MVEDREDSERGCGFRKAGGLYLISGGLAAPCGLLPIPLDLCPVCGHGIKFSRGFTWVDGNQLVAGLECLAPKIAKKLFGKERSQCDICPLREPGRVGLLWVGEQFYKTPEDFTREAARLGISRRIGFLPRGFKLGETWIWLAHKRAIESTIFPGFTPGVFQAFKPTAVEYVTHGDESPEDLEQMIKRGITPVRVTRAQTEMEV